MTPAWVRRSSDLRLIHRVSCKYARSGVPWHATWGLDDDGVLSLALEKAWAHRFCDVCAPDLRARMDERLAA